MTLCSGSLGARPDNDLPAMMDRFAPKVHFLHLRNVSARASAIAGSFHEAEHLEGDTDMVALIAAILREEARRESEGLPMRRFPMRPDHGQEIVDDLTRNGQPGYPLVGRLRGLAELRGVERALKVTGAFGDEDRRRVAASRPAAAGRSGAAPHRARPLRGRARPADRQPARPHRPGLVRRPTPPFRGCGVAAGDPRPLSAADAAQPGRELRRARRAPRATAAPVAEPREAWRCFARHYHLFAGTPSALWVDHAMSAVLGCEERLTADNADALFDHINAQLAAGIPPARAAGGFRRRDHRHHGRRARSAPTTKSWRGTAGSDACARPTGRTPSPIPTSRAFAPTSWRSAR
jgi:hypothetical protein